MPPFPISSIERDVDRFTKSQSNASFTTRLSLMYWLTIAAPCTGGGSGAMKSIFVFMNLIILPHTIEVKLKILLLGSKQETA